MMTTSEKLQIIETLEDCDTEGQRIMAPIRWILEAEAPYLVGIPATGLRAALEAHTVRAEAQTATLTAKAARQRAWEARTLEAMVAGNRQAAW
ncbi:MAG: hypothetical protein L0H86_09455 [Micrococcaceae bacterium]|nr:hypothetical protein [Micrococcaceae bacterium]MDN5878983.1 hypothetical protein [Micrococcaceae bacterium]MDN5905838.1 hypothetical protein [Micrococcaceae bacterium]